MIKIKRMPMLLAVQSNFHEDLTLLAKDLGGFFVPPFWLYPALKEEQVRAMYVSLFECAWDTDEEGDVR